MARTTKQQSENVKAGIKAAVDAGIYDPEAVAKFLAGYGLLQIPTKMTIITHLNMRGVKFVGEWRKVEK